MAAAEGHNLPPHLPPTTVLLDIRREEWNVGKVLGSGGFGTVYTVGGPGAGRAGGEAGYVVKVEPHMNGPLAVELRAILHLGRDKARANWQPRQEEKPVGWVGLPSYVTHGSHLHPDGTKLRFIVMSRFGQDLEKNFLSGKKPFPLPTVLNVAVQLLDTLEFIHSHNYTHNDIKADNILLDSTGRDIFLVDFGLARKYKNDQGIHCDDAADKRRAHNGTLAYASRDAHTGARSRRGDLESLGYCLVHWAGGQLPWLHIADRELVEEEKKGSLASSASFLSTCFRPSPPPAGLAAYWETVAGLAFSDLPDYEALRAGLTEQLALVGGRPHDRLMFTVAPLDRASPDTPSPSPEEGVEEEVAKAPGRAPRITRAAAQARRDAESTQEAGPARGVKRKAA